MNYRVIITDGALADVERYLNYLEFDQELPATAVQWWERALEKLETLRLMPHRCPRPPEDKLRDFTIRALIVGQHLFLYRIDEESRAVEVFGFRHGSQLPQEHKLPK